MYVPNDIGLESLFDISFQILLRLMSTSGSLTNSMFNELGKKICGR